LPHNVISELIGATEDDDQQRRSDWFERDRAIILTALLAGQRSEELINSNIGDLRRTADGAVIHVRAGPQGPRHHRSRMTAKSSTAQPN
jgi:integrase